MLNEAEDAARALGAPAHASETPVALITLTLTPMMYVMLMDELQYLFRIVRDRRNLQQVYQELVRQGGGNVAFPDPSDALPH